MLLMSCFIQSNKLQTVFLLSLQIAAELNAVRIAAILFKIGYWWLREGSHRAEPADSTTQRAVTPSHAQTYALTQAHARTRPPVHARCRRPQRQPRPRSTPAAAAPARAERARSTAGSSQRLREAALQNHPAPCCSPTQPGELKVPIYTSKARIIFSNTGL